MTAPTAATVWADYNISGVPSSGVKQMRKSEAREWGAWLESFITAIGVSGSGVYLTRADLFADLAHDANDGAWVLQDPTAAYNGIYRKLGLSGAGSWSRVADLPYSFILATATSDGTVNAIEAESAIPVSGSTLTILQTAGANTTSPVTVSFNDSLPLTIKTAGGNDVPVGGMTSIAVGVILGSTFRLLSDITSSAIQEAAEDAATLAQAWSEGTLPGGAGTKSAKEWAQVAEDAVTYNRAVARGTIAGTGPYDVGVPIGSANNIDIKVGGVIFDHNLYTISGTAFTFLTNPGDGQPWEAVVQGEVRSLAAPSDGTVGIDQLTSDLLDRVNERAVISADMFGAVYDGTPGDQDKIKAAAMAAVAAGVPFLVPNKGFAWSTAPSAPNEGLVLRVPEDFATIQDAHDATLNWIFPATPPRHGDTTQNHILPVCVTISVAAQTFVQDGLNITWNHPHGDQIRLKGRGKTALTLASQQALTFSAGIQFLRLRFSNWPAVDPVVDSTLQILNPGGSGEYMNFEGGWRITAVDPVNKDLTVAVRMGTETGAVTSIISSGIFFHHATLLKFVNQPASGADVGCIDVHTTLRMSDIALSGSAAGTNASSTDGIMAREGARVLLDQHCAISEFQRSGLWLLNGAYAQIGYAAICGNNSGLNILQSRVDGTNCAIQGNTAYNLIVGIGSSASIVLSAFGGSGGTGVYVTTGGCLICSGSSRRSQFGINVDNGGIANINDMNVRGNKTIDVRRRGSGRIVLTASDSGTFSPALGTFDNFGGFTALKSTLDAVA